MKEEEIRNQVETFQSLTVYLLVHFHTFLTEALVVIGLPWGPVGEGDRVLVGPEIQASEDRVRSHTGPHVTGGYREEEQGTGQTTGRVSISLASANVKLSDKPAMEVSVCCNDYVLTLLCYYDTNIHVNILIPISLREGW